MQTLGLRRDTYDWSEKGRRSIVAYDADWEKSFENESDQVRHYIGHLVMDIQHVGSTSVPGLHSKPIIDIAVAVSDAEVISQCRGPLCTLCYINRGIMGENGGYLFVKESEPNVITHHLHIVAITDPQWDKYLLFRDALTADITLRERHVGLKKKLQRRYSQDRKGYTTAKSDFIRETLKNINS